MDDMTLERSLRARPPVDPPYRPRLTHTPGITGPIDTPPQPMTRRTRPMLTATRLVAAIAIVSLGAGALLFSVGSDPSPVPASTPSPSPTTWTPPPGLVTEELAPGVLFASHAGVGSSRNGDLAFGADGGIWLLNAGRLMRVGDVGTHPGPSVGLAFADLSGSPDGALWSLAKGTVASFRDGAWTTAPAFPGDAPAKALEVLPDGTVWARSTTTLARLDGDAWTAYPIEDDQGQVARLRLHVPGRPGLDAGRQPLGLDLRPTRRSHRVGCSGSMDRRSSAATPPPPQVSCYRPWPPAPRASCGRSSALTHPRWRGSMARPGRCRTTTPISRGSPRPEATRVT